MIRFLRPNLTPTYRHLSTAVASRFSSTDSGMMGPCPGKAPLAMGVLVSRSPYCSLVISIHLLKEIEAKNIRNKDTRDRWKRLGMNPSSSLNDETPESRAKVQASYGNTSNAKAVAITASRMGLSEREVLAYLTRCKCDPAKARTD